LDEKSICRCDEGLAYNASSNLCVAGTIVVISDVKLNQTFLPDYGDRKTTEHVSLAIKLEEEFAKNIDALGLLNVIGIHVVSMKEGSIDVTFALVLKPGTSVNVTRIQEKLRKAMGVTIFVKDGGDAEPIVQVSDICNVVGDTHRCGDYAECLVLNSSHYECKCHRGYMLKDNKCVEKDQDLIIIVIPILVACGLITLLFLIIGFHRRRRHNLNLERERQEKTESGMRKDQLLFPSNVELHNIEELS